MALSGVIPILRIFDVDKAVEFYVDFLGFTVEYEHRFADNYPLYMQVRRDNCILHLSEHHGDASPGAQVRIAVDNLDELHKSLKAKQYTFARPSIETKPWGSRDMMVGDPFGNRLTFTGE